MAKIGVSLKIDVSKIDKNRLFKGQKGTYLDATVFIDTGESDQYGNNGMITQDVTKQERDAGTRGEILGNCKVFWQGDRAPDAAQQAYNQGMVQPAQGQPTHQTQGGFDDGDSDIPF